MFWPFLLAASIAIGLIQLGALTVWVSVLSLALKAILLLAVGTALYFGLSIAWQRHKVRSVATA